jgi:acyl-CoA dehydrogenase
VHKVGVARAVLRDYEPTNNLFPSYHIPAQFEAAMKKYGRFLN